MKNQWNMKLYLFSKKGKKMIEKILKAIFKKIKKLVKC